MSVELLVSFAGTIAAIAASTATLGYWLGRKFEKIEMRFKEIDKRLEKMITNSMKLIRGSRDWKEGWRRSSRG
jgi:membrane protein YqaA with SNARE-associated domain